MQLRTVAIRLPPGTALRDWLAEHEVAVVPPTEAQRAEMVRLADTLEAKGPIGRRKDRDDRIELRFGRLRITVVADGALIAERVSVLDLAREPPGLWHAQVLTIDHGLVLYDPDDGVAIAPPGVDLGPEPYAPPRRRRLRLR
jgi:hypothetical protein